MKKFEYPLKVYIDEEYRKIFLKLAELKLKLHRKTVEEIMK